MVDFLLEKKELAHVETVFFQRKKYLNVIMQGFRQHQMFISRIINEDMDIKSTSFTANGLCIKSSLKFYTVVYII